MNSELWYLLPIAAVLGAIHLFKPKWGWIVGARRPLDFADLDPLLTDKKLVRSPQEPASPYPGARNYQFLYNGASVLYHRTINEGWILETVSVYVPKRVGIKFTLKDSRLVTLEKPRGTFYDEPHLAPAEWTSVLNLTKRVRELAHV